MSHIYLEYRFKIQPRNPSMDILLAQLSELPFESFEETDDGLNAYIRKEDWNKDILQGVPLLQNTKLAISHSFREIPPENWNEQWETNFKPIEVGGLCVVRAPFHPKPGVLFDIVIEPKMSFGTGHHETTHMMLQFVLNKKIEGKTVLDMGCGTAVLAILAAMKGAAAVDAIDIDHWSYLNARENADRNKQSQIVIYEGDVSAIPDKKYDLILANINRNILLKDIPSYCEHLEKNGALVLSGFYDKDEPLVTKKCKASGLMLKEKLMKNHWVSGWYHKV